jgi:hypothetical protein
MLRRHEQRYSAHRLTDRTDVARPVRSRSHERCCGGTCGRIFACVGIESRPSNEVILDVRSNAAIRSVEEETGETEEVAVSYVRHMPPKTPQAAIEEHMVDTTSEGVLTACVNHMSACRDCLVMDSASFVTMVVLIGRCFETGVCIDEPRAAMLVAACACLACKLACDEHFSTYEIAGFARIPGSVLYAFERFVFDQIVAKSSLFVSRLQYDACKKQLTLRTTTFPGYVMSELPTEYEATVRAIRPPLRLVATANTAGGPRVGGGSKYAVLVS